MILAASVALCMLAIALWLERHPGRSRHISAIRACLLWTLAVVGVLAARNGKKHFTAAIALTTAILWCIPSAIWAYATLRSMWMGFRNAMHAIANTAILLAALPAAIFSVFGGSWRVLFDQPNWKISLWLHLIFLPAILGLSAIQEFYLRGAGTPDPWDPPERLVRSGVYSYISNPMEVAAVALIAAIGIVFHSLAVLAMAAASASYFSLGSDCSEQKDLATRFADDCDRYRAAVRPWRFRWLPFAQRSATLYVAQSCGMCSELGCWFAQRKPVDLRLVAAEEHPTRNLSRITYDPGDGCPEEYGVAAFARALEHINLAWAFCGFILRLPLLRALSQVLVDASGGEARLVSRNTSVSQCAPASFVISPT